MATKMKLSLIACHPANPKDGDLCVWNMHDPPHTMDRYAVVSLDEAKGLIRKLTAEQLADPSIGTNAFGLEVFRKGLPLEHKFGPTADEWEEWEDEDGYEIMAVMARDEIVVDQECPNCGNGTIGLENGNLVCRGECGNDFGHRESH